MSEEITTLSELRGEQSAPEKVSVQDIKDELGVVDTPKQDPMSGLTNIADLVRKKKIELETEAVEILEEAEAAGVFDDVVSEVPAADDMFADITEDDELYEEEQVQPKSINTKKEEAPSIDKLIDELGMDFNDEEDGIAETQEEIRNVIKTSLNDKLKPITKKIDLSTFTVSKTPKSVLRAYSDSDLAEHVIDWRLDTTGINISMREFKARDIVKLNPEEGGRNQINTFRDIYKLIFDHIVNEDKPDFETLTKLIKFDDIPHLYFAILKSSFEGNNIMPYQCTNEKCKHIFSEDNIPMDELVKYKDEKVEQEFKAALASNDSVFTATSYETVRIQISDNYVVELRHPSIFNVIFETLYLSENVRDKYNDIVSIVSYIESIYIIDTEERSLHPINVKTYTNDAAKTVKDKIAKYARIINELTSDQYYSLTAAINTIASEPRVTYVQPARTCPKCGTHIAETEQSPENMLFSRHRLGAIAYI